MKTEQASLFGIPNTIFGIMGFTALATFGTLMLSGAKFKKWIWQIAQLAATVGVIFTVIDVVAEFALTQPAALVPVNV